MTEQIPGNNASPEMARLDADIHHEYQQIARQGLPDYLGSVSGIEANYTFGDYRIRIEYGNATLKDFYHPAIAHNQVDSHYGAADFTIVLLAGNAFDSKLIALLNDIVSTTSDGQIKLTYADQLSMTYQGWTSRCSILDRKNSCALVWIASLTDLPSWERSFSLRSLLNQIWQQSDYQLVHAAGIEIKDRGILIAGKSGSGKSTLALSALLLGLRFLGDDFVLLNAEDPTRIHSMYKIAKLDANSLALLPQLREHLTSYEDHDKYHIDLIPWTDSLVHTVSCDVILLPHISDSTEPHVIPAQPNACFGAIALSTLYLLDGSKTPMMQKIGQAIAGIPAYHFYLTPDLDTNINWLRENIRDL